MGLLLIFAILFVTLMDNVQSCVKRQEFTQIPVIGNDKCGYVDTPELTDGPVYLQGEYTFYGQRHSHLHFCDDGYLLFESEHCSNIPQSNFIKITDDRCDSSDRKSFAVIDTLFEHECVNAMKCRIKHILNTSFGDESAAFSPTHIFYASWTCIPGPNATNTEILLTTDNVTNETYAVLLTDDMHPIDIQTAASIRFTGDDPQNMRQTFLLSDSNTKVCGEFAYRVDTLKIINPGEPLTLEFTDNTPFVHRTFVMANFRANKPAKFTCTVHYRRRFHSTQKTFVTLRKDAMDDCHIDGSNFSGHYKSTTLEPSLIKYTLVIRATYGTETATLRGQFRIFSSNLPEDCYCAIHMINTMANSIDGAIVRNVVRFTTVGKTRNLTCKNNTNELESCGENTTYPMNFQQEEIMINVYTLNVTDPDFPVGINKLKVFPKQSCLFTGNMNYRFDRVD